MRKGWDNSFPTPEVHAIGDWADTIYPAGGWREKSEAVKKAVEAKDFPGASKALAELGAALHKSPYPAFAQKAADLE